MKREQIKSTVKSYIDQAINGLSIENNKFDFKRKWYNLKEGAGISEFLKDTTAIANTVGLDGLIVIGFDEKKKEYYDSTFSDSGLRDSTELGGIISKNVDKLFNINQFDIQINNHTLSVIEIPISFDKPHVIRGYKKFDKKSGELKNTEEHRIFVRNSSGTRYATKYDLDFMYFDRKNIIPELDIHLSVRHAKVLPERAHNTINIQLFISIENIGRRTISMDHFYIKLQHQNPDINDLEFSDPFLIIPNRMSLKIGPQTIKPNDIRDVNLMLKCKKEFQRGIVGKVVKKFNDEFHEQLSIFTEVGLTNGEKLQQIIKVDME